MNLSELLPSSALDALASQLGIPRDQAERGAKALLPAILGGLGDKAGDSRPMTPAHWKPIWICWAAISSPTTSSARSQL